MKRRTSQAVAARFTWIRLRVTHFMAPPGGLGPESGASLLRSLEPVLYLVPLDVLEERVDVLRRRRAIVNRVGMLVHVHHQERRTVSGALGMVPAPMNTELGGLEVMVEHRPAAPTGERHPYRTEELLEPTEAPEGAAERGLHGIPRLPVASEVREVELVEHHRVVEGQLTLLQASDHEPRGVL